MPPPATPRTAADVADLLETIYGAPVDDAVGVIHPTAVWAHQDQYHTLRINDHTPRSRIDRFVLNAARGRADALLTTGRILRDEPTLTPDFLGSSSERDPVRAWRRDTLGKPHEALALVLTSGRELDLTHPFFASGRAVVFTSLEAAEDLVLPALERGVDVVGHPAPSPATALAYLRDEAGCALVSVEAGPTTSRSLYSPVPAVDELLLSVFAGPALDPSVAGPDFVTPGHLDRLLPHASPWFDVEEESGPWRFQRRRPG